MAKVELDLVVKAPDLSGVADRIQRDFHNASQNAGRDFGRNLERGIHSADTRGAANRIGADFGPAGARAGRDFGTQLNKSVREAVSGMTAQFGPLGGAADSVFARMSGKSAIAAAGVAGIGIAAVGVGKQLYDLGSEWDSIADGIATRTGKLGDELKALTEGVKTVAADTAAPLSEIGDAAGRLEQSLHLSGKPLQDMTKAVSDFQAMTGEQLDIRDLGKALRVFSVDAERYGVATLDSLYRASVSSGQPINELVDDLIKAGPAAKDLGLGLSTTAGILSSLEDAGVDPTALTTGLRTFSAQVAKDGGNVRTELEKLITDIQTLPAEQARQLSQDAFGTKTFQTFFDVIRSGQLDVQSLNSTLSETGPGISEMREATSDWQEELQKTVNSLKSELEPAASTAFSGISVAIDQYLTRPFRELNDIIGGVKTLMESVGQMKMPSGPAILDANGNMVPTAQPPALSNPLGAISGAPGPRPQLGRSPLDVFAPTTRDGQGGPTAADFYGSNASGVDPGILDINAIAKQFGLTMSSGVRNEPGSYHHLGAAGDFAGSVEDMRAFAEFLNTNFGDQMQELIFSGPGWSGNLWHGKPHNYSQGTLSDHTDHVHAALADDTPLKDGAVPVYIMGTDTGSTASGTFPSASTSPMGASPSPLSAGVDADFGLSRGLAGFADNAVRFLGNLATAPLQAQLAQQIAMNPGEGSGLIGIAAANGAFGPQYMSQPTLGAGPPALPFGPHGPQGPFGAPPGPVGYQPTQQPAAPQGWQPGAKGGGGGGIAGAAMGAAASMIPGAGAGAQIAMQAIQRTIQYGGEVAGSLAQGALDFFSVSDPDGGPGASLGESWLGRLAGSFASAAPALPSTAGSADKASEAGKQQAQQGMDAVRQQQGLPPGVHIDNFVAAPNRDNQQMLNDLAYRGYASGTR